jgi:hypothetical protein
MIFPRNFVKKVEIHFCQFSVVKDDIIHGHLDGIYFLKFLSISFIFYRGKKGDPGGGVAWGAKKTSVAHGTHVCHRNV